ncbi:unnamed protein product [Leptidea sinapis]|uniref:non-specific serine/threonine protein kinase n=1 Tax=Leptidea sinapis TaxID=189913 RepID=A0A5E4QHG5_9NEOP|nr:unnamed protein product [Leptidea sinapis]
MSEESYEERQNNELVALQAIYGDAVVDIRKKAVWNEWRPLNLLLTLQPLHNSEGVHCSATLNFKCLTKVNGLSDDNAAKLLKELNNMAAQLCGEQFLHDHNKPTLSFYEEMLKHKTEIEKLKQHDIQRQKMKDEIQRRQLTLKSSERRDHKSSLNTEDENNGQGDAPKLLYSKGTQVLRYTQRNNKKVYIGNCLGHSLNGSTTYLALDDDGDQVIAKKWFLLPAADFQTRNKQLNQIQQDLKTMCRIKQKSLTPYTAMELTTESSSAQQVVYIFRDFILGSSLKYLQNKSSSCGDMFEALKLVRHVGLGVFSALMELHSVNVLHRDVRSENVFLEDSGAVKLVGAGLDMRLMEIYEGETYCDRCLKEDEHTQWSAEELVKHGFLVDAPPRLPSSKDNNSRESESEDEDGSQKIKNMSLLMNGHSRLNAEFEVKNKLDGGFYAIKHVKLNPMSVDLNKKITREVKLLSRLNHENVVRYYNAWIESVVETRVEETPSPINWSMSEGPVQARDESSDSDEETDDDEPDLFFNIMNTVTEHPSQMLYIQMEFCEKNTLRQAIDNGLYQEHYRAWRLFREILEGLAHVHQKGMIHRDLKPVNIFLDSNDHVKIGDFGLATKVFTSLPIDEKSQESRDTDGLLTGKIGTTLYVAPELQQSATKVIYNQKVDIYSLGIILFEMFTVLSSLRKKEIVMPSEFVREENAKQIHVISEHVPRAVPEGALSGLLSHTLADRGSRGYQRLVSACLDQKPSPAEDFTYQSAMKTKPMETIAAIKDVLIKVFRSHGATEFSPPLLTPRADKWEQSNSSVKVMTVSGAVCHLPHDLRLPFVRHIAYSGTKYIRRYVVDRVYRETERTVKGFHPREIIECAFDMVTPSIGRITSLQLQTHLATLCVTNRDIGNLLRLMEADVEVKQVRELVGQVKRDKWSSTLERAVRELETVCGDALVLGCECPITVAPFLAYNATQHRGVFWQMSVMRQTSRLAAKHRSRDLIAAGGSVREYKVAFKDVVDFVKQKLSAETAADLLVGARAKSRIVRYFKSQNILDEALLELVNIVKANNSYQSRSPEDIQLYALYSIADSICRIVT